MVPTVKFDDLDSKLDLGLELIDYYISPAERKTKYLSIPGKSGDLDLTPSPPVYKNRTILIYFYTRRSIDDLNDFLQELESILAGKRVKLTFSNDNNYYWNCRVQIKETRKMARNYIEIDLECNANPYKVDCATNQEVPLCTE